MFTGLVDAFGVVVHFERQEQHAILKLQCPYSQFQLGESIAVNGVCLTLVEFQQQVVTFDISSETLKVTNLGELKIGDRVHCERALEAHSRLGGHVLTGHVDSTAQVISLETQMDYVKLCVGEFSKEERLFLIKKGSIALNGVSLTINAVSATSIELMLVPHTLQQTTFSDLKIGQILNVEFDYMTRIIAQQLKLLLSDSHFTSGLKEV